jgi:hypothetical protein
VAESVRAAERILKPTSLTGQSLSTKKPAAKKPAAKKKKPAKHRNAVNKGYVSPLKEDCRTHGSVEAAKRVSSTGLAGGMKRQACKAVHWERECREIQAQINDLPQNIPYQGTAARDLRTLYSASWSAAGAKADRWIDKVRTRELDMRNGAWICFDIDEAIKTSDRRKSEVAAKNPVPNEE